MVHPPQTASQPFSQVTRRLLQSQLTPFSAVFRFQIVLLTRLAFPTRRMQLIPLFPLVQQARADPQFVFNLAHTLAADRWQAQGLLLKRNRIFPLLYSHFYCYLSSSISDTHFLHYLGASSVGGFAPAVTCVSETSSMRMW